MRPTVEYTASLLLPDKRDSSLGKCKYSILTTSPTSKSKANLSMASSS